jgi:hypothetical protein
VGPWTLFCWVVVFAYLTLMILPVLANGGNPWGCPGCCAGLLSALLVINATWLVGRATRRYECVVTPEEFKIRTRPGLGWQTWAWDRREVEAVGAWNGLWVIVAGRSERFCSERDPDEVGWLAEVLQDVLGVAESARAGLEELQVVYRSLRFGVDIPGVLRTVPGKMTLVNGYTSRPVCHFKASPRGPLLPLQFPLMGATLIVAPDDLSCRSDGAGGFVLEVEPTGSRFPIVIWNADGDALPRALERFWAGPGSHG